MTFAAVIVSVTIAVLNKALVLFSWFLVSRPDEQRWSVFLTVPLAGKFLASTTQMRKKAFGKKASIN